MFLKRVIDDSLLEEANHLSKNIPLLNNSITHGQGTLAGCIGEIAVRDYIISLGISAEIVGNYDYDILTSNNKKIEVKTKRCASIPKPHYECSVANFNDNQGCDFYFFTRVSNEFVYLLGYISKSDFVLKSTQKKSGDVDSNILPNGKNFQFHADCRNLFIYDLNKLIF